MPSGKFIPSTETALARNQLQETGHVGLSGLYEPSLADQALLDMRQRFIKWRNRLPGERAAQIRPSPIKDKALLAIIQGIRHGAMLLGHDLEPGRLEVEQLDVIDMEKGARGRLHRDKGHLLDVVAATNLQGESSLWFEGEGEGVTYTLEPGLVVIQDLDMDLLHQGAAGAEESRMGLVVGKHPR